MKKLKLYIFCLLYTSEFARRLDMLLRNVDSKNVVINTFKDIANQVSVPVLFQVKQHFTERNNEMCIRDRGVAELRV